MTAYYNENDPYCADWLENLIREGFIAGGTVDRRSITEVRPADLVGFSQCHFFAGVAGWSLALRLAGWPDERECWTGSCPCQPFSAAGRGKAADDERHLWPAWSSLIAECRPPTIFGEQIEAAVGWGWLDVVFLDLEAQGYACGAAVLPACSVGAPHIRQRLWFVAHNTEPGRDAWRRTGQAGNGRDETRLEPGRLRPTGVMADADSARPGSGRGDDGEVRRFQEAQRQPEYGAAVSGRGGGELGNTTLDGIGSHNRERRSGGEQSESAGGSGLSSELVNAIGEGLEGYAGNGDDRHQPGWFGADAPRPAAETGSADGMANAEQRRLRGWNQRSATPAAKLSSPNGWADLVWLPCSDGKARPTEPGLQPLAHGVPGRVGRLRAYGNAIVPQVAAEFIGAFMDVAG